MVAESEIREEKEMTKSRTDYTTYPFFWQTDDGCFVDTDGYSMSPEYAASEAIRIRVLYDFEVNEHGRPENDAMPVLDDYLEMVAKCCNLDVSVIRAAYDESYDAHAKLYAKFNTDEYEYDMTSFRMSVGFYGMGCGVKTCYWREDAAREIRDAIDGTHWGLTPYYPVIHYKCRRPGRYNAFKEHFEVLCGPFTSEEEAQAYADANAERAKAWILARRPLAR